MTLEAFLTKHEGRRLTSYVDSVGVPTIGIGRNILARPITVTDALVDAWFQADLADVVTHLTTVYAWFPALDKARQSVLIDLCFNLGLHGLMAFENMLAAIIAKNWQRAHDELLHSRAHDEEPARIQEDAQILLTGVMPTT